MAEWHNHQYGYDPSSHHGTPHAGYAGWPTPSYSNYQQPLPYQSYPSTPYQYPGNIHPSYPPADPYGYGGYAPGYGPQPSTPYVPPFANFDYENDAYFNNPADRPDDGIVIPEDLEEEEGEEDLPPRHPVMPRPSSSNTNPNVIIPSSPLPPGRVLPRTPEHHDVIIPPIPPSPKSRIVHGTPFTERIILAKTPPTPTIRFHDAPPVPAPVPPPRVDSRSSSGSPSTPSSLISSESGTESWDELDSEVEFQRLRLHRLLRINPMDINVPMIQYDFRFPPTTLQIAPPHPDLPRHTSHPSSLLNPATDPPTRLLYLVADELPWPIRIERTMNVTCKDVLDVVYETLQMLVTQPEWFIAEDAKRVVVATTLQKARVPDQPFARPINDPVRRIDWLGDRTIFLGIKSDAEMLDKRVVSAAERPLTRVLVLGRK